MNSLNTVKHGLRASDNKDVVNYAKVIKSTRKNRKEIDINRQTIGRIVKEDLNYKTYVLKRRILLTVPMEDRFMAPLSLPERIPSTILCGTSWRGR